MLVKNAKFILIIAAMALIVIGATACQTALGQSNSGQPSTGASVQSTLGQSAKAPEPTKVKYVGQFSVTPSAGLAGTTVKAAGNGFDPNSELQIVWQGLMVHGMSTKTMGVSRPTISR